MKKNLFWILIITLCSLPAILALFHPGFFQSDDGEWMIIRFSAFHQAFRDGQFPIRFLERLNFGYGYPIANFLYPGFMYLGELFKLLGFGFVGTIKIILGLSALGSAVFIYLWLSKLFDKWSSFVGSMLYLYAPYHLFDLYKRGSVGEVLALCFAPFVLWQIERKSFFWTSLGIAFLVLSHNTLALLFLPLIIVYLISRGLPFVIYFLPSIILGLGLSTFFWIPAIFDLQYTVFSKIQVSDWQQYFAPLSLVGLVTFLIFAWTLIKLNLRNRTYLLMVFAGIISLFFSLSISSMVGEWLPVSTIQFPFRFLSVSILTVSFLTAFLLNKTKGKRSIVLGIIILPIAFLSSFSYLTPSVFFDKGDSYYATNEGSTTVKNEYMPKWIKTFPREHFKEKVQISSGTITDLNIKTNKITFSTTTSADTVVTINTVFFPGWRATVDGRVTAIDFQHKGLIQMNIPSGWHKVVVSLSETKVRLASDILSLVSLAVLLALCSVL